MVELKCHNNTLLLIVAFLFLSFAHADIIGGHSKQRLGLIFLGSLTNYYAEQPLSIYLRELPITVFEDTPNQSPLSPLLQVLAQEDLLSSEVSLQMITLDNSAQLQTRAITYFALDNGSSVRAELGEVTVLFLSEMEEVYTVPNLDIQQRYRVRFRWSLSNEAEWIWASELNSIETIRLLRAATINSQTGIADFEFGGNQWRLSNAPNIYDK